MSKQYQVWGRKLSEATTKVLKGEIVTRGDAVLYEQSLRDDGYIDTDIREGAKSSSPGKPRRSMRRR